MPARRASNESPWQPLLRRADQGCLAVVVAASLLVMGGYALCEWRQRGGLIEIDEAPRQTVSFKVDVNEANWPELTLLPGIGETLAKNIVDSRERRGPFRSHDDLRRVKGIGRKTLDKIKPYLLPIDEPGEVVGK